MLGVVLVWCLNWYYAFVEAMRLTYTVLCIKFKKAKEEKSSESKGHLALRLNNNGQVLKTSDLLELIEYCRSVFGVKYLTLIAGNSGFEREIDLSGNKKEFALYNNYQELYSKDPQIHVNLVDNDSEALFLLKVKETLSRSFESGSDEFIYNTALKSFTSTHIILFLLISYVYPIDFPPIDLFLCMTHNLDFNRLFPLHLSFTHF